MLEGDWGLLCDGLCCRPVRLQVSQPHASVCLPQSANEGSFSPIYCAVAEEMEGITGKYIDSDCSLSLPAPLARDPALAVKDFEICERLTSKL